MPSIFLFFLLFKTVPSPENEGLFGPIIYLWTGCHIIANQSVVSTLLIQEYKNLMTLFG